MKLRAQFVVKKQFSAHFFYNFAHIKGFHTRLAAQTAIDLLMHESVREAQNHELRNKNICGCCWNKPMVRALSMVFAELFPRNVNSTRFPPHAGKLFLQIFRLNFHSLRKYFEGFPFHAFVTIGIVVQTMAFVASRIDFSTITEMTKL